MKGHMGLHMVTWILIIIGGLNWLALGLFNWDISMLFGGMEAPLSKIIYVLVGLSAIYEIIVHKQNCKLCASSMSSPTPSTGNINK